MVGDNYGTITYSYSSGSVSGKYFVGGLVGGNWGGTITNSYSSGSVSDSDAFVGGLVGYNYGTITNSYSSGSVSGSSAVGGLIGVQEGTITNSYSSGSVSGSSAVGGLVGWNNGTITNSYSSGSVSGSSLVGGFVGVNYGTITNSYSSGSVSGDDYVGGLVGWNNETTELCHNYCYNCHHGSDYVGGLVGANGVTITNSYWDIFRSGQSNCVGVGSSSGCTGKNSGNSEPDYWYNSTHAPMDQWDFNTVWGIVEGVTYPYLRWQYPPKIISFAPPSPVNDTVCTWRTFNVTVNQTVNVSWYLNGSLLHTNESVREANYTLHAQYVGENNVSAVAKNANGTDMQTWVWNVTLNCTCGDICVNETGWWRHGGAFIASNTPIQAAIDSATAGDAICVKDGTYNENVVVTKSHLTIRSENGPSVTTVSASLNPNKHVFDITDQTNVTLEGFEIRDAHGATQHVAGIYMYNASECNIFDNIVTNISATGYNCAYGIRLDASSNDNSFSSGSISDINAPTWWDFYSDARPHRNSAENITISSFPTTISFTYDNGVGIKSVETPPADPADKRNISKYVNAVEVTADSWIFMNVSYEEVDLGGVDENSLRLWKHNGTDWTLVPGTNGVNTAENYVYANITEFGSIFAPLGNPPPVSPLNCTCGDICVNTTGWWRDGGAFIASSTPIQHAIDNAIAEEIPFALRTARTTRT